MRKEDLFRALGDIDEEFIEEAAEEEKNTNRKKSINKIIKWSWQPAVAAAALVVMLIGVSGGYLFHMADGNYGKINVDNNLAAAKESYKEKKQKESQNFLITESVMEEKESKNMVSGYYESDIYDSGTYDEEVTDPVIVTDMDNIELVESYSLENAQTEWEIYSDEIADLPDLNEEKQKEIYYGDESLAGEDIIEENTTEKISLQETELLPKEDQETYMAGELLTDIPEGSSSGEMSSEEAFEIYTEDYYEEGIEAFTEGEAIEKTDQETEIIETEDVLSLIKESSIIFEDKVYRFTGNTEQEQIGELLGKTKIEELDSEQEYQIYGKKENSEEIALKIQNKYYIFQIIQETSGPEKVEVSE